MRLLEYLWIMRVLFIFALALTSLLHDSIAVAGEPTLAFDFGRTMECRDVTPPEFTQQYPHERIVECSLRLSVYLVSGVMDDVEAIRVEIGGCDQRLIVYDFSPRTRLESGYAGDIETTTTHESSRTVGASLGGEMPAYMGGVVAQLKPGVTVGGGGKEVVTESLKRIAPKHVVVASGTIHEEQGVFFTLRPSNTSSLEGTHQLSVQFIVPADWRGGAVRVSCRATGNQSVLWLKQQKVWAQKSTPVALYLAGDTAARRAAQTLALQ